MNEYKSPKKFNWQSLNTPDKYILDNLIPKYDNLFTVGTSRLRWKSIHIGEGTIYITDTVTGAEAALTVTDGVLLVDGVSSLAVAGIKFGDATQQNTAYVPPAPQTFDPLFTDINGTVTNVVATGSYTMLGPKICYFRVSVNFTASTNYGNSQYQITLPFASAETMRQAGGTLHQISGTGSPAIYHIAGITDTSINSSVHSLYYSGSVTDLPWKFNTPGLGVWANADSHFDISGTYEIA